MKRIEGILIEGEKIGLDKQSGKDNKVIFSLHILRGFDSIKLGIKDIELVNKLESVPNRKPIKVSADIITFKDEMYLQAKELLA